MRRVGVALLGNGVVTAVLIAVKAHAPAVPAAEPKAAQTDVPAAAPTSAPRVGIVDLTRMTDGPHLGAVVPNYYGPVQVRIDVGAGRLVDVEAVQLPTAAARGIEIGMRAAPVLRQQALQRQSADLDTVSGATYTSDGYRRSLQSAGVGVEGQLALAKAAPSSSNRTYLDSGSDTTRIGRTSTPCATTGPTIAGHRP